MVHIPALVVHFLSDPHGLEEVLQGIAELLHVKPADT
jgi:hypothetical protein